MRAFLQQPYPFSDNTGRKLLLCAGVGLFITLFLALFQPFGFDELTSATRWSHALAFGVVTFVVASFFQIVPPLFFPPLFREANWRSWKEILYLLLTTLAIGGANYGLMLYLYPQRTELANFLRAELITLQVGIFPICFIVFMKQMSLYRHYRAAAEKVTEEIQQEAATPTPLSAAPDPAIELRGDNQKEVLSLSASSLLFIASSDNYVRVQYREEGLPKSLLLRSTLKKMEEQLALHPSFIRCHRMYLVNLQLVNAVSGNAQGLRLHLTGFEEPIPVSRSLTETVKNRLQTLSHSPQTA